MNKPLKELQKLLKVNYKKFANASTFNNRKSYYFGKCEAYRTAIKLIKGV
jgi:hypothetical protein